MRKPNKTRDHVADITGSTVEAFNGNKTAQMLLKKGIHSPKINRSIKVKKMIIAVPERIKTFQQLLKWRRDIQFKYGA